MIAFIKKKCPEGTVVRSAVRKSPTGRGLNVKREFGALKAGERIVY